MKVFSILSLAQEIKIRQLSSYSWLIILLGVILNIGLWLFCWQQINYEYNRKFEETSRETMNLCISFEEHVRRIISDADNDLLDLKQAYERDGISSPIISAYTESMKANPTRNQITVINNNGTHIASFNKKVLGTNISDREYFRVHSNSSDQNLYIGKPITTRMLGQTIIPLTRRIDKPDKSFDGIVYIGLRPDYFRSFYDKMDLGPDQLIALAGLDWIVRARQSSYNVEVGQDLAHDPLYDHVQSGRTQGTYTAPTVIDGITRVISYRVMPDYPLVLFVGKDTHGAFAANEKRKHGYILWAILFSLFILFFSYLLVSRAEQKLVLNKELLRLSSLNTVGEMAAGIGHEIRNPLTTVRGYLQMFQRKPDFIKYQEHLQTMIDELDRANAIISEFLSLAKNKTADLTQGNLNDILNTLIPLMQADALHRGHDIQFLATDIPDIQLDQSEIRQLILNLARNGLEAMESSGKLTIQTYLEKGNVILAIKDTGPGIPAEVSTKLGTPFVTTKESGTGLGLPVCFRIMQKHSGKIDINTSNHGTTFFVKFPCQS